MKNFAFISQKMNDILPVCKALTTAAVCGILVISAGMETKADTLHSKSPSPAFSECMNTKSGGPLAGFSVFLDSYYDSLSHGRVPDSVRDELTAVTGLTKEETGYLSVLDIYNKLGVANVSGYLNIRETPDEAGIVVGTLTEYGGCEILEEVDGWYKITSGSVTGYVSAEHIAVGREAKKLAFNAASLTLRVDTPSLRIRTEPSTDARIWTHGYQGEFFGVEEDLKNGWVKLTLDGDDTADGNTTGFVFLPENATIMYTLAQATAFHENGFLGGDDMGTRQSLIDYAMQFLGNPYVWGGTDPNKGADCSGFTQYVLKYAAGVAVNRTSREQQKQGLEVSEGDMRPGDLIFYSNSQGIINHVALYIGNGQVIHSASKKTGVKISAWNYRTPVSIKDVIG